MIVAVPTVPAVTLADALLCPTGIVIVAGTPATAGALLLNATGNAAVAGALRLTVSVTVLPTQSVCLDSVTPESVPDDTGRAGSGVEDTVAAGAGIGCGAEDTDGTGAGGAGATGTIVKTAVQPRSAVIVTAPAAQVPLPDQPSNVDPGVGLASSVTTVPFG